jgi:hypothetical protein
MKRPRICSSTRWPGTVVFARDFGRAPYEREDSSSLVERTSEITRVRVGRSRSVGSATSLLPRCYLGDVDERSVGSLTKGSTTIARYELSAIASWRSALVSASASAA